MKLPAGFTARIETVFGDAGRAWLADLPRRLARCRARWALREGRPSPDMSLNYLELCRDAAGRRLALKLGLPHPELFCEMETLCRFGGDGMVGLVDFSVEDGALLLDRVEPGTMLWRMGSEAEQLRIFADVLVALEGPARRALEVAPTTEAELPRYEAWFEHALARTRREARRRGDVRLWMPSDLLDRAELAMERLLADAGADTLLHADLHHENVLLGRDGWTVIDPKGAVGPACLEVGRYIHNRLPLDAKEREAVLAKRIAVLAEVLGEPARVTAQSALVDGVLSLCWMLEDLEPGSGFEDGIVTAAMLSELLDSLG